MQNRNSTIKKITALMAAFATVLVLLFSTVYLSEHAGHHCNNEECPICAVMEQCSNNIKNLATAFIVACVLFSIFNLLQKKVSGERKAFFCNSLISQKVRMNN